MKKVLVLFGGVSSEHDVSCVSASYVVSNIPRDKYEVCPLGITKEGEWFLFEGDVSLLPEDKWIKSGKCTKALLSPDRKDHGITVFRESGPEKIHIDVCFPVMHGKNGEDGTIQGLLELSGIPYVGCGVLASSVCMDKAVTNTLADQAGIAQAKWLATDVNEYRENRTEFIKKAEATLGYPIFVKPAYAGRHRLVISYYGTLNLKAVHKFFENRFSVTRERLFESLTQLAFVVSLCDAY